MSYFTPSQYREYLKTKLDHAIRDLEQHDEQRPANIVLLHMLTIEDINISGDIFSSEDVRQMSVEQLRTVADRIIALEKSDEKMSQVFKETLIKNVLTAFRASAATHKAMSAE